MATSLVQDVGMSGEEEPVAWLRAQIEGDGREAAKRLRRASSDAFRWRTVEKLARAKAELAILDACAQGIRNGRYFLAEEIRCLLASGYKHRPGYREEDWKS
jgi:hypothetical protein